MPDGHNIPRRSFSGRPDWAQDGHDWPNRRHSRFVTVGDMTWHVQVAGAGPVMLLLHGTAASTHSWRDFLIPLSEHYTVVAVDLPGHGFSSQPPGNGMTLAGMASRIIALEAALGVKADYIVGHSAGVAIGAQICLDHPGTVKKLVSLNGALMPMRHGAPFIAKVLAKTGIMPLYMSWKAADTGFVEKFMLSLGSKLDPDGIKFYARLARRSGHTGAALTMMANWDLASFYTRLPKLSTPLLLIVGEKDGAVPPSVAETVQKLIPGSQLVIQPNLGHLAHEESPAETIALIRDFCQ
jgi:magnesium chelatase accessory protein